MTAQPGRDSLLSAADNRRMFDAIARRYDRMNRLLSLGLDRRWRRRAVAALAPRAGGRYLDVGCGTGDVVMEVLRQCPRATVVGVDPAEAMLGVAVDRLRRAGLAASVSLRTGDATDLAFADASFDGVVTAFCIRNVTHRAKALGEMRRVLSPGGRAVILELTVPAGGVLRAAHRLYTGRVVPLAGRLVARNADAYRYLVESIREFPHPRELLAAMDEAGFAETRREGLLGGTVTVFVGRAD